MRAMDHSFLVSLHSAKQQDVRAAPLSALSREDVLELDITKNGLRFGHEIEDHLVTFAVSLNDHLLEFLAGRDIIGML